MEKDRLTLLRRAVTGSRRPSCVVRITDVELSSIADEHRQRILPLQLLNELFRLPVHGHPRRFPLVFLRASTGCFFHGLWRQSLAGQRQGFRIVCLSAPDSVRCTKDVRLALRIHGCFFHGLWRQSLAGPRQGFRIVCPSAPDSVRCTKDVRLALGIHGCFFHGFWRRRLVGPRQGFRIVRPLAPDSVRCTRDVRLGSGIHLRFSAAGGRSNFGPGTTIMHLSWLEHTRRFDHIVNHLRYFTGL